MRLSQITTNWNFGRKWKALCFYSFQLLAFLSCAWSAEVALPKLELLGSKIDGLAHALQFPLGTTLPQSIKLEFAADKISGVIYEYSQKTADYTSMKAQMQRTFMQPPRVGGPITTVWRLEAQKCAVMLTWDKDTQLMQVILRPLSKSTE